MPPSQALFFAHQPVLRFQVEGDAADTLVGQGYVVIGKTVANVCAVPNEWGE